ncbi:FtsX-like permease family protein [Caldicellulosiruptor changbaiensis]|uniref:FtsX-like permease family protein n=1 Tax=Caldicellulosiruptor changbaiensis TaxID=1222016 RepID=A0A3T0D9H5_9FIRM|nr:ABC transporter permease [Caldicellulosiruptor changbaiensis]AZT91442.1 FtsX-like permease family protein [Caldicellulosiruptor changbaiensis]
MAQFALAFKMAIKSILSNKLRSFLTMLGVIIGIWAVIAVVGLAQGSTKSITDRLQRLGTNLIQINITGRNSNRNVTYEELQQFAEQHQDDIEAIAPTVSSSVTLKYGTNTHDTTLVGTTADYSTVRDVNVSSGRFILPIDVDYRQKVALVGTYIVKDLFNGQNPIGQKIKINGQIFTVVGVLEERANSQEQSDDDQVIVPVTVAQRLTRNAIIRNFAIKITDGNRSEAVMNYLNDFLMKIYNDSTAFRVFNTAQLLDTLNSVTQTLTLMLAGIAAISLIVGGIGIMNIMLVSVTERTREIGIRKAIGAKRRNILVQFLIEASVVTGLGGVVGIILGFVTIRVMSKLNIATAIFSIPWAILAFTISLAIGIVFGLFPASKASRLNPIEALRYE